MLDVFATSWPASAPYSYTSASDDRVQTFVKYASSVTGPWVWGAVIAGWAAVILCGWRMTNVLMLAKINSAQGMSYTMKRPISGCKNQPAVKELHCCCYCATFSELAKAVICQPAQVGPYPVRLWATNKVYHLLMKLKGDLRSVIKADNDDAVQWLENMVTRALVK